MTFARYGLAGQGPASQATESTYESGAYTLGAAVPRLDTEDYSGVYRGSLSSQGSMVAMLLNTGSINPTPYLTGYIRQYYKDPLQCTFGANSAIPALTGVMPSSLSDVQGNFLYYLDLQLTRASGSNYFDTNYFINVFNQASGWVETSNPYTSALNLAEETNLEYYGFNSYAGWITQGINQFQQGQALLIALKNIGKNIQTVNDGLNCFASPGGVAKTMIDNGLGQINGLTEELIAKGVDLDDIYNPNYSLAIAESLAKITNPADLQTIQTVLESTVPNMKNPLDYCQIETASGLQNDSAFQTFIEVGNNLFEKTPALTATTGLELANMIESILSTVGAAVEALASPTSLLPQDVIDYLRRILPTNVDNQLITILNIIGAASGYLTYQMQQVNRYINELDKSKYGPLIRKSLEDISKYAATGMSTQLQNEINAYFTILSNAAVDPDTIDIVQNINQFYLDVCSSIRVEYLNYNKANFDVTSYSDNIQVLDFVASIPGNAQDTDNIKTGYMLYNMALDNEAGQCVQAVISQFKNIEFLSNAGIRITSTI